MKDAYAMALSIRQPWANLIIRGSKDVENRTRATPYRGPILIHASKTLDTAAMEYFALKPHQVATGAIIGAARLVDCVKEHPSTWFENGFVGWVLDCRMPLPPIPYRGQLGLFRIRVDVLPAWMINILTSLEGAP
jgi:hypothetical protein